ncbi:MULTISPECIES: hypothetical protein [unclassified Kribbella]|uniref:hypothetical protein n=1 Tax=unclassified Kribbella TaxID=2644121 RepID=UPI0034095D06
MSAIDLVMLAVIGVLTPIICFGGIGLAYRTQQRAPTKKPRKTPARRSPGPAASPSSDRSP